MTVEELINKLKECDARAIVVNAHGVDEGLEDISTPAPMELVRRTDKQMAKEVRGRTLSRYRAISSGYEKPNVKCVTI